VTKFLNTLSRVTKFLNTLLGTPPSVEATTEEYRKEMDPLPDFLEACTVEDSTGRVLNAAMWESYQAWSRKNRDRPCLGRKTFTQRLEKHSIDSVESGGHRYWLGIRLRYGSSDDKETTDNE
jgi:phage/plasmid-associated DNA primase